MKLTKEKYIELDIKRLYLGTWETKCPNCGADVVDDEYESFIETDKKEHKYFCCNECDYTWEEPYMVELNVKML